MIFTSKMEILKLQIDPDRVVIAKIDHRNEKTNKCILFIHGYFSGNSFGPNRLFVELADIATKLGYCSARYDWIGMGDSPGKIDENNFEVNNSILNNLIDALKKKYSIEEITFVTHSLGASILLSNIENFLSTTIIKRIFFLSPAPICSRRFENEFLSDFNTETSIRKGLRLNSQFIKELTNFETVEKLNKISIKSFIFYAKDDNSIDSSILKSIQNKEVDIYCLETGGHNFLSFAGKFKILKNIEKVLNSQ